MKDITVQELAEALQSNKKFVLLDVREDYEYKIGHIEHNLCEHIPMGEIPTRASELDNKKETHVICRSGKRAAAIANYLKTNYDFTNIGIVLGGIETYANEIDQSIEV